MIDSHNNNHLIGETDAQVWAKTWLEVLSEHPDIATDEGTMIGWFANAIMSGYDDGVRHERERDFMEKLHEIIYQTVGAATVPFMQDNPDYVFPSERVIEAIETCLKTFGIPAREDKERYGSASSPEGSAQQT